MELCISSYTNRFKIKKENIEKAFKKLYDYAKNNKSVIDNWMWCDSSDILDSENLSNALEHLRWDIKYDEDMNIKNIEFSGEKLGNDFDLFCIIAEFVEDGYIEVYAEDDSFWRWYFINGECTEVFPTINWE